MNLLQGWCKLEQRKASKSSFDKVIEENYRIVELYLYITYKGESYVMEHPEILIKDVTWKWPCKPKLGFRSLGHLKSRHSAPLKFGPQNYWDPAHLKLGSRNLTVIEIGIQGTPLQSPKEKLSFFF